MRLPSFQASSETMLSFFAPVRKQCYNAVCLAPINFPSRLHCYDDAASAKQADQVPLLSQSPESFAPSPERLFLADVLTLIPIEVKKSLPLFSFS